MRMNDELRTAEGLGFSDEADEIRNVYRSLLTGYSNIPQELANINVGQTLGKFGLPNSILESKAVMSFGGEDDGFSLLFRQAGVHDFINIQLQKKEAQFIIDGGLSEERWTPRDAEDVLNIIKLLSI